MIIGKSNRNINVNKRLSAEDLLTHESGSRPEVQRWKRRHVFDAMVLRKNISELKENTVYRSIMDNGVLYDAMTARGTGKDKDKAVNCFQSSYQLAKGHKLDYGTIGDAMEHLHLFDEGNKEYRISTVQVWR